MIRRSSCWLAAVVTIWGTAAGGVTLSDRGKPAATIVLCRDPIPAERTAAEELAGYLQKITGAEFRVVAESTAPAQGPAVYLGPTALARSQGLDPAAWRAEQWAMKTVGERVLLVGGRPRGTLYAVDHFLEDVLGVHWWNPWEESVPRQPKLDVAALDRRGEPRFRYRDIYLLYAADGGRFAARSRLNGQGFGPIDTKLGSGVYYGPPGGVHTFYIYIPPETYFAAHPEWFSLLGGKRTAKQAQLCLTNEELRAVIVEKLRAYIRQARADAQKAGRPAPVDFDISQNDWHGLCECPECQAIAKREGTPAGPLVEFLNHVADAIRGEFPQVRINTLAYQMTEDPPRTLRPRDNIVPRLCDTNANLLRPITHADNRPFAQRVAAWGRITKDLRIWDYAVTYRPYPGLPLPTVHTYPTDYRYFAEHNVEGVFTEHEHAITADLRDLKVWMMMKLLEDPYADYEALLARFTDGFYGPAGKLIRRYLVQLQAAAEASASNVNWFPALNQYRYLTLDFLRKSQALFDEAEQAAGGDPVLLRRVRHARLPVDRATLVFWTALTRAWARSGGTPETIPLARDQIAARAKQTWYAQIDLRFSKPQRAQQRAEADRELGPLLARRPFVPLPEKFRGQKPSDVFDFTAEQSNNWKDQAERVPDAEAECGITNRLELGPEEMQKYKLPMPWGVYDPLAKRGLRSAQIKPADVPGPGYHWYKLGPARLTPSAYVWFFWSWIVQFPLDGVIEPGQPDQSFDIWARIKFEGPGFAQGKPGQPNAISVERVVAVRVGGVKDSCSRVPR